MAIKKKRSEVVAEGAPYAHMLFQALWGDAYEDRTDTNKTPERFVAALHELTTPKKFDFTMFESTTDEMVVVDNIPFFSLCAHHVLPFIGVAHVAYVPNGKIAGLSKLARSVKWFSAGLQVQEELTSQIAESIEAQLRPQGVGVIMEAEHMCMTTRGVMAPGSKTTTSVMLGCFADHTKLARQEFQSIVQQRSK